MVEKMVEKMGFLVEKEEEEGGEVVVVVGMEEEMEERMVEALVMKEVERSGRQGRAWLVFFGAVVGLCLLEKEEGKKIMKEREEKVGVYIYKGSYIYYKFAIE